MGLFTQGTERESLAGITLLRWSLQSAVPLFILFYFVRVHQDLFLPPFTDAMQHTDVPGGMSCVLLAQAKTSRRACGAALSLLHRRALQLSARSSDAKASSVGNHQGLTGGDLGFWSTKGLQLFVTPSLPPPPHLSQTLKWQLPLLLGFYFRLGNQPCGWIKLNFLLSR